MKPTSEVELDVQGCGGELLSLQQIFCNEVQKVFAMFALEGASRPVNPERSDLNPKM